ncbi:hypothetical protein AVEN_111527-1 [Araneus ventricosus]|uniref:Uncharacterized protein n=1 Tax=Araneus ventricosus TaxID=182803 RepID=A0A4Y2WD55_ARAVE|nr:hypothetical protein AVEN_191208-1 [Araneus ventricosus]GBO34498.1 hypothetical protein AVEN_210634-1 [Araneus ventricosus]GBO36940.1 hypothetical protein AVEN_111527-1 [Araneus ventricosus]
MMIGNLANDLKMAKNETKLLQGDIKNFNEERRSLLLQIQERNKHVGNLKTDNDSLVKMNAYSQIAILVCSKLIADWHCKSASLQQG